MSLEFSVLDELLTSLTSLTILGSAIIAGVFYYWSDITEAQFLDAVKSIFVFQSITEDDGPASEDHTPSVGWYSSYTLHGQSIADSTLWLENTDSAATRTWIQQQNQRSVAHLDGINSLRSAVQSKMELASRYEVVEPPFHIADKYFCFKKLRSDHTQFSLYVTHDLAKDGKMVFDSRKIACSSKRGSQFQSQSPQALLHGTWISGDGNLLAYGYSTLPESADTIDVLSIGVRDLSRKVDLPADKISAVGPVGKVSVRWLEKDNVPLGFFYTASRVVEDAMTNKQGRQQFEPLTGMDTAAAAPPPPPAPQAGDGEKCMVVSNRVYFHRLGSACADDLLLFEVSSGKDAIALNIVMSSDGHYLIVEAHRHATEISCNSGHRPVISENFCSFDMGNKVYFFDLTAFSGHSAASIGCCMKLIDVFAYRFEYISNIEQEFWFRTNFRAPNFRVVRITLPEVRGDMEISAEWEYLFLMAWKTALEWIPERPGCFLESAGIAAHTVLVLKYLKQDSQSHEVLLYDITQILQDQSRIPVADLPRPLYGTITGPYCSFYSSQIFYRCSDLSDPGSIYRAVINRDLFSGSIEIFFDQLSSVNIPDVDKYQFETINEICIGDSLAGTSGKEGTVSSEDVGDGKGVPVLVLGQRDTLDSLTSRLRRSQPIPSTPRPCIVIAPPGFGAPVAPVFSLPLLLFVQHCGGIVALIARQARGDRSYSGRGKRPRLLYAADPEDADEQPSRDGVAESAADLRTVLQHLIRRGFTSPSQMALFGGSHGGLALGLSITQHAELFAAAVINNGLFDLLRYQIFNPAHNGGHGRTNNSTSTSSEDVTPSEQRSLWSEEYGCATQSEQDMQRMRSLSPLHAAASMTIAPQKPPPAVMLHAVDLDSASVVSCIHSLKFGEALQTALKSSNQEEPPVFVCVSESATSNAADSRTQLLAPPSTLVADMLAFMIHHTNSPWMDQE